ncbi:MAG: SPOR domain-containing protein [Thermodesulfovibrionales bacterium]|nr:SPOR domain-containing protein [Thermodesulfovibrionales bacterium]
MKYGSLKAKRKTALPDRKFIIAIIIVTSALSFSLGYFVGGAGDKGKQPEYQIITVPKLEATQVQAQPAQGNTPQIASASGRASQPQIAEEKAPAEKPLLAQPAVQKEPAEPKVETDNSHQDDIKYTVQAGAFKNLKEAETLKHKLETKGYKAYIKKYAKSKNPKLYKVRTGEFTAREEEAALALKLKNEGLKAFVTLKNEEAHRDKNSSHPSAAKKESLR